MHALGLDQQQSHHFASFAGQNVVGAASRSGVHGLNPNPALDEVTQPMGLGKAELMPASKQDELCTAVCPRIEIAGAKGFEWTRCPRRWGHFRQAADRQRMRMSHTIDFDPGPVIGVDGRCVGFVRLKFHGVPKVWDSVIRGRALDSAPERGEKCGQIIGFPSSTLPLEAL